MSEEAVVLGAVAAFVEAINKGDIENGLSAFAPDATIVEDIAPFRWHGRSAASDWLEAMRTNAAKLNVSAILMKLGAVERVEVELRDAYVVILGCLQMKSASTELHSNGLLTLTLIHEEPRWLINTLTWSGPRPTDLQ